MMTKKRDIVDRLSKHVDQETLAEMGRREAWFRGDLRYLLLPGAQTQAYDMVHSYHKSHSNDPGPCVLHMHRGSGKSWLLVILALERCLSKPNQQVRIGAPRENQTIEITEPALRMLLTKCPKEIYPHKKGTIYEFRNPRWEDPNAVSKLILFGAREQADSQRGKRSNLILFDEVRDLDSPEYVIGHVLGPHFVRQSDPLFVLSSTSPATTGHAWWNWVEEAQKEKRYIFMPVTDNTEFGEEDEKVLVKICGGKDSVAWKREALCLKVADESLLAVPSFSRNKEKIVCEWPEPTWAFPFIFGDIGFVDASAILAAYLDYKNQKIAIVDEVVKSGIGTAQLIDECRRMEKERLAHFPLYERLIRWADATPRELDDFRAAGLHFLAARKGEEKWEKWTGLARLESLFYEDRIVIHPRCRNLIYQLENAVRNERRTDLEKTVRGEDHDPNSPILGHYDALWALAYGVWQVRQRWLESPYPKAKGPGPGQMEYFDVDPHRRRVNTGDKVIITRRPVRYG